MSYRDPDWLPLGGQGGNDPDAQDCACENERASLEPETAWEMDEWTP